MSTFSNQERKLIFWAAMCGGLKTISEPGLVMWLATLIQQTDLNAWEDIKQYAFLQKGTKKISIEPLGFRNSIQKYFNPRGKLNNNN